MEAKETQDKLKSFIENIQLQFALGRAEALEEFEKQKTNLNTFLEQTTAKMAETADKLTGTDTGTQINSKLQELKLQLALGKAETKDAFEKQVEAINNSIKSFKDELGTKYPELMKTFDDNTMKLNSIMESLRLQFSLGQADLKDGIEGNKSIMYEKLSELKQKIDEGKNIAEEKFEGFKDEALEAFNHLRNAFKKLT